ncbi:MULTISPECIES: hypothetical protein [Cyanophyceae]|uniref:Protein kinase domain-containing protein n=1 Tax=Leptolyngbya subtilissima DQ-A4 TaxID=2933933 RepID=A0ABV0K3G9_9CYAN|nr:hypothetical protein [Nodosilinea sp. FACHB-141]MBD2113283.1 hypothetical protein [Nodosilinea sp. FACHB-141]
MSNNSVGDRLEKYFELSAKIAQLDSQKLHALLSDSKSKLGWGLTQTITVGQSQVFVKRIPVTQLEYDNLFSTKNLYDLPTYFNYGLGSAGLGVAGLNVFRELITHIKTSQWVLEGAIAAFPLVYHYRILPYLGLPTEVDKDCLKEFVAYWGNHENTGTYMLERANARYELVLFLEYLPQTLATWLQHHPHTLPKVLDSLREIITFLGAKGVIHFDAHFRNILTDGKQLYLTDFGLALDQSFALSDHERAFFETHRLYDYGEVFRNVGHMVQWHYDSCSQQAKRSIRIMCGIKDNTKRYELATLLLANLGQIHTNNTMDFGASWVAVVVKYCSVILLMRDFFFDIWGNTKKNTEFPHKTLQQLLTETGFLN